MEARCREAELVQSQAVPFVLVRLPGTTGGVPSPFRKRDLPIVEWDAEKLATALDRLKRREREALGKA